MASSSPDSSPKGNSVEKGKRIKDHMNFVRCFICKKTYTNPKLLPCLHSFCLECLVKVYGDQQAARDSIDLDIVVIKSTDGLNSKTPEFEDGVEESCICCPMCKTKSNIPKLGLEGFKDNLLVIEMVRLWEEKLCEDEPGRSNSRKREILCEKQMNAISGTDNSDKSQCTCIPIWKKTLNGKIMSGIHSESNEQPLNPKNIENNSFGNTSPDLLEDHFYCISCDSVSCPFCEETIHKDHSSIKFEDAVVEKRNYLDQLLSTLSLKNEECERSILQVRNCSEHINIVAENVAEEIEIRYENMIASLLQQKNSLKEELKLISDNAKKKLSKSNEVLDNQNEKLKTATKFTSDLLKFCNGSDLMYLTREVSDRLHVLLKEEIGPTKVTNMKLEIPTVGQDTNHISRLFGSVKQSEIKCGSAELLQSFTLELKWPTGMATTPSREFVVTGKMGAFEEKGKVMFFSRAGILKSQYELEESCIPYDTTVTDDGLALVADNGGNIHKFNSFGRKLETMIGKFQGVGRLATIHGGKGQFAVTSSDEQKVKIYDYEGQLILSFPSKHSEVKLVHPHYVATNNNNDVIVSDYEEKTVCMFDLGGKLIFKYSGSGIEHDESMSPSAVCCDKFNNVLIADFMNDRVHMLSPGGLFLGYLLTKEDKISCPNFLSVDEEGHLFVGQYGGQIHVFQYMSFVKII